MNIHIESLIERYETQIQELQDQVYSLQEKNEQLAGWADTKAFYRPRVLEDNPALPTPRLQIELSKRNDYHWDWLYGLVYVHTTGEIALIPIGQTSSRGGHFDSFNNVSEAILALPYPDARYIWDDAKQLNLPAFILADGKIFKLEESLNPYNWGNKSEEGLEAIAT